MTRKQKSLRDVSIALQKATDALEEIERRALYEAPPDLSFEQKVIKACRFIDEGHPVRDVLSFEEMEQAVKVLADVYTVTGVKMPPDWY